MRLAIVHSLALSGLAGIPVRIEVQIAQGLPAFHLVGLPAALVRESRERVRAAINQSGFLFPQQRLTVNLAPADLPKDSNAFELPIAIGILAASGQLPSATLPRLVFLGELSLAGELQAVRGAFALGLSLSACAEAVPAVRPPPILIVPPASAGECAAAYHGRVWTAPDLGALVQGLQALARPLATTRRARGRGAAHDGVAAQGGDAGQDRTAAQGAAIGQDRSAAQGAGMPQASLAFLEVASPIVEVPRPAPCPAGEQRPHQPAGPLAAADFAEVCGEPLAQLALGIAAAGGHHLLMVGPPGGGKTMLALVLARLVPPAATSMRHEQMALASLRSPGWRLDQHPDTVFRQPHHSASMVALCGGGVPPRPGEISLAHGGVLFLDELPEFDVKVLDALRQPLEAGALQIARGTHSAEFPARFQLVAAMNPCPCGYAGLPGNRCACSVERIRRYQARVSGPIRDRIDLQVEVLGPCDPHRQAQDHLHHKPRALLQNMLAAHGLNATEVNSASIRALAQSCRKRQHARQAGLNAHLAASALLRHAALDDAGRRFAAGLSRLGYSHRAMHGLMRVARSIADMLLEDSVGERALALAAQLRRVQAFPPHPAHYEPAAAFRAPATD